MSNWYLQVGKTNGEWDYSVGGIMDWSQQEFDDFYDMCQDALVVAKEHYAQNTKAFSALREALPNTHGSDFAITSDAQDTKSAEEVK